MITTVVVGVLLTVGSPAAFQPSRDNSCAEWRSCRDLALAAADRREYETFHNLAWRAVQTGPPRDPALMYLLARAQALSGRPHDALVMLDRLAEMGVASDGETNQDFSLTRELPGWPEVSAKIARLTHSEPAAAPSPAIAPAATNTPAPASAPAPESAPVAAPSPMEAVRFSTPGFTPGGLAYDSVSGRFLFGDRLGRKLFVVGEGSNHAVDFVRADSAGFRDISALEIDPKRGDLWVASASPADGAGTLHKLQLISGRPLKSFPVGADLQPFTPVDLAVTPAGVVFVLDSAGRQLLVLRAGGTALERVMRIDAQEPASLAAAGDDGIAYVAHRDGVSRIDVRARTATPVTAPGTIPLAHLEHIRLNRHSLIAIRVNDDGSRRIVRLDLNPSGRAVTHATTLGGALPTEGPTFVTVSGDELVYFVDGSRAADRSRGDGSGRGGIGGLSRSRALNESLDTMSSAHAVHRITMTISPDGALDHRRPPQSRLTVGIVSAAIALHSEIMPAVSRNSAELRTVDRYESLIRVSETLGAYHDRDQLFQSLARELHRVVTFNFLGLALYDEQTHTVVPHVLQATGEPLPTPRLSTDGSIAYWIVQHQQPLQIQVEEETRFPEAMAYMRSQGIRSVCALPLTTHQRRVGMLLTGSQDPRLVDADEMTFLSLVANQVALAIDDALNHEALQRSLALERERADSLAASDELLRALSPVLDVREVFPRISDIAMKVLAHDRMTMAFHDRQGEGIVEATSNERGVMCGPVKFGDRFAADTSPFLILPDLDKDTFDVIEPADFWDRMRAAGYRSLLLVRRCAREQRIALGFWARQPGAFDVRDVPVAQRIADHVALAVSHEQLAEAARQAAEAQAHAERLEARVRSLTQELDTRLGHGRVVGPSESWKAVLKAATQVSSTDTTVLLTGESGTGKEVVARFIHRASARKRGPFVALNCAALPEHLLEAELFGYERGAFTGAQQSKPGQLELAAAGVLFLDEVSEMSLAAQAKFLRVLQEREFQRLGGTRMLKANVRVIAASNRDLKKAMARGDFREDLFYRLRVFDIRLPPLRERTDDILPLSEAFLHEIGQLFGRPPAGLTRDAKDVLLQHEWPGNVRELRNALERAAILCEGGLITAEHLSLDSVEHPRPPATDANRTTDLNVVERDTITQVLRECDGNKSKAAKQLGLSRTQLYVRLRKYQIA